MPAAGSTLKACQPNICPIVHNMLQTVQVPMDLEMSCGHER
jgi:hypothetical protein